MADKILALLVLLFVAGLSIGGWGYLLCAPLILGIVGTVGIFWLASRHFKGIKLW